MGLPNFAELYMKLLRLFQPRNPLFWLMLALNGLSAALAWMTHNRSLRGWGLMMVLGFTVANAMLGTYLAWRLVKTP